MPFIPHTEEEVDSMLSAIGADGIEALFDEIPEHMRSGSLTEVPEGIGEMDMLARMSERAADDETGPCFLGAGCYDHYIPAAVDALSGRSEFYTAYTPYQPECSQNPTEHLRIPIRHLPTHQHGIF